MLTGHQADEANRIYMDAWGTFIRDSQSGNVTEQSGLLIASGRSSWPGLNLAFLQSPLQSLDDLKRRIRAGIEYYGRQGLRWLFVLYPEWARAVNQNDLDQLLVEHDLFFVQEVIGMWTDTITRSSRPSSTLQYKSLDSREVQTDFAMINAQANRIPEDWAEEAVLQNAVWTKKETEAFVGYLGREPVTTAMLLRSAGSDFVGWVATRPEFQRAGHGEAALRYTISQMQAHLGAMPLLLHATPDGVSLYERLGFRECARFQLYLGGGAH